MICTNCGTANEPGTRFCDNCGTALSAACPNCGSTNRPNAKFCATCGTSLTGTPAQASQASQRGEQAVAERRLVTVLFADLVGSTPFAEDRDPEQVRETLDRYYAICRLTIERHGGTIEKFIGDAVMAVWGTPTAHEDDAERAVRSALELVDSVHSIGLGIEARAGVMTGETAVTIGAEGQGMVAGDLVNTASRLQGAAPAGSVLVGEATMHAAEAAVAFEPVGEQELKGKSAPVAAFRATRVVANRGGGSRAEGLEAPFVGRDEELRQLKELLHTTARDPRVRLVSIIGPAGIGKSRLTWEFEKYVDGLVETIFWHRGRSPAYGEGVTFWALGEMVRRRAQLTETDDEATTRRQIADAVAQVTEDDEERAWLGAALLALLGVEAAPPGGRDALFVAWRIFFERIAAQGTTALVFEDVQWADDGLLDFIEHVLEWSKNLPLLIITLSRPELFDRRAGWASGHRFMTAMALEPLRDDEMRALLAGLVPGLPDKTVADILERADGIPLYAVEIVRMLVADGKLQLTDGVYQPTGALGDLAVPETLRSLIASRLDALDPADRALLQDASVLGQRFTLPALAAVTSQDPDSLEPRLRTLARREFVDVELDPRSPERGQYGFVQSLIREVAYGTLSKKDRRARHLAAARYFEALGDEELAGALATHYLAAYEASTEGPERDAVGAQARLALGAAGERAAALGAHAQAVTFLSQALAVTPEPRDRAALLVLIADSANPSGQHELADSSAREAVRLYREAGDDTNSLLAAALLGRVLIDTGKIHEAGPVLEDALARRPGDHDDEASAAALAVLARVYMRLNKDELAVKAADRALVVAERENARPILAEALLNKGTSYGALGRRHEGRVLLQAAVDLAAEIGSYEPQLRALNNLSSAWLDDDPARGLETVLASAELAERMGQAGIMNWQRGTATMFMTSIGPEWDTPVAMLEEMLATNLTAHDRARTLAILSLYRVARGEDGAAAVEAARSASEQLDENQIAASVAWSEALLAYLNGHYLEAIDAADRGVALWRNFDFGMWPLAARAAVRAGRLDEFDRHKVLIETTPSTSDLARAYLTWLPGVTAALDARPEEAARLLIDAADRFRTLGFRTDEAWVLIDAVHLLSDDPRAADWADRARTILQRLKAAAILEVLETEQGSVRGNARPRTAREETEVASEPA